MMRPEVGARAVTVDMGGGGVVARERGAPDEKSSVQINVRQFRPNQLLEPRARARFTCFNLYFPIPSTSKGGI